MVLWFIFIMEARSMQQLFKVLKKNHRKWQGVYVYISATKSHREQKLVSNYCFDTILLPYNKLYKQADFLVAQLFKKT